MQTSETTVRIKEKAPRSSIGGSRDTAGTPGLEPDAPIESRQAESRKALPGVAIAYAGSALIVFFSILAQFMTAGTALFAPAPGASFQERWEAHVGYGPTGIMIGSILLIALSFAARQPWRWTGAAVLLLALALVQGLLVQLYSTNDQTLRLIAALHVVNAGVIFGMGFVLLGRGVDALRSAFRGEKQRGAGRQ